MPYPPTPPPQMDPPGDVFGPLADYLLFMLRAPLRHRKLAAAVLVAFVALGAVASWALPKKYRVDATLLAQRNPLIGALSGSANRESDSPTRAVREMVIRRDNLVALCRETDFLRMYLERRPPAVRARDWLLKTVVRYERSDAQLLDDLVSSLQASLSVGVSNEGAVTIGFVWSDPEIAYRVVDAAVKSFVRTRSESDVGSLGDAIAILQGHDLRLQKEIAEAIHQLDDKEQALRIRTAPRRSAAPSPSARKEDEEQERLRATLAARRRALADVEDIRQRRTAELQAQLSQQLTIYAPEHPSVTGTRQAIASLSAPSPQAAELKVEIAQLERKLGERPGGGADASPSAAMMDQSLAEARARLLEHTDPRLEYERRQLETLVRRHASLLERIESARIELDGARSAFEQRYPVITPAKLPRGPLKPYGALFVVGGMIVGLVGACAAAGARDLWGGRIVEPWQVEKSLQLPIIVRVRR